MAANPARRYRKPWAAISIGSPKLTARIFRVSDLSRMNLRGHGLSDKPSQAAFYSEGKRWGDELNTVMETHTLRVLFMMTP